MKNMLLFLTFLFCFITGIAQSNKVDSLKNVLNETTANSQKIDILSQICNILIYETELKYAKPYLDTLIKISKSEKNHFILSETYRLYSGFYIRERNLEEALNMLGLAKEVSLKYEDYNNYLLALCSEGALYSDYKMYDLSILSYNKGIELIKKKNLQIPQVCSVYIGIGHTYFQMEDEIRAIDFYVKSMECADAYTKPDTKVDAIRGLAWIYIDRKDYEKAENYLLEGIQLSEDNDLPYFEALLNRILGKVYNGTKQFNKALIHQKKSLTFFRKIGSQFHEYDLSHHIANTLYNNKEYKEGLDYANNALIAAIQIDDKVGINASKISVADGLNKLGDFSKSKIMLAEVARDTLDNNLWPSYLKEELYRVLQENFYGNKDYELSIFYLKRLSFFKDSINDFKYNNKVVDIETKYQTEKKEKEILQLNKEKTENQLLLAEESKEKWLMGGGLLAALATLTVFGFYYRRNSRQKRVIENLQKELHHRVKNNLSIIDTFIEVTKEEFTNEAFQSRLSELQNRIESINEVHLQLYANKDVTNLNLNKYIERLADNVQKTFAKPGITVTKEIDDTLHIPADKSFPLGLIINEFLTNSYKYAFKEDKGIIKIIIKDIGPSYELILTDNGIGLPHDFNLNTTKSFGSRVMKLLSEQLKGNFQLEGTNGVQLKVQFPKI